MNFVRLNNLSARAKQYLQYALLVTFVFGVLVGFGVTTSHSSVFTGDASEKSHTLIGAARHVRSDEFLRGTPEAVAKLRGAKSETKTPFDVASHKGGLRGNSNSYKKILIFLSPPQQRIFDFVQVILPLEQSFALNWWWGVYLLFLALPAWFALLGGSIRGGALTAIALLFVTPSAWFSYAPAVHIGIAAMGCTYVLLALKVLTTKLPSAVRYCGASFLVIIGMLPLIELAQYPPWGFPVLAVSLSITISHYIRGNRLTLPASHALFVCGLGAVVAATQWLANKTQYTVTLNTVYPGKRRSSGGSGGGPFLGGSISWLLQTNFARTRDYMDPEKSYGPTILFIPYLALVSMYWQHRKEFRQLYGAVVASVFFVVFALWSQAEWPSSLLHFNPLVLVTAFRVSTILGPLVILLLGHALSTFAKSSKPAENTRLLSLFVTLGIIIFSIRDVEWLRTTYYIGAPPWKSFISVLGSALIGGLLVSRVRSQVKLIVLASACVATSIFVNPITVGLGPLSHSHAVTTLQELSRTDQTMRWATTGFYEDALMVASGVPQMTGQQSYGPDYKTWELLDPQRNFESAWNRAQTYINFQWDIGTEVNIWNPSPDVIQVVLDPCEPRLDRLQLGWIITPHQISSSCAVLTKTVKWMSADLFIYQRQKTL